MFGKMTIFQRLVFIGILLLGASITSILLLHITILGFESMINGVILTENLGEISQQYLLEVRKEEKEIFINVGDPVKQEEYLKKWEEACAKSTEIYNRIKAGAPDYSEDVAKLQAGLETYRTVGKKVFNDSMNGQYTSSGEANDAMTIVAKKIVDQIHDDTLKMTGRARLEAETHKEHIKHRALIFQGVMLTVSFMTILGLWLIARGIAKSLSDAQSNIIRLGHQDFTVTFDAMGGDEIASIGRSLNEMTHSLRNAFQEILSVSQSLGGVSEAMLLT